MIGKSMLLLCTLALVQGGIRVNDDPSQAPTICAAEDSDGILIAHEDCSKFYKCSKGKPAALDCPKPLLYNAEKEWCDWPENVNCDRDNESSKNERDNSNNAEEICAAEGSDGVLVPHEVCSMFYKCSQGKPVVMDCPPPLVYDDEKKYCDWPENVNCVNYS